MENKNCHLAGMDAHSHIEGLKFTCSMLEYYNLPHGMMKVVTVHDGI